MVMKIFTKIILLTSITYATDLSLSYAAFQTNAGLRIPLITITKRPSYDLGQFDSKYTDKLLELIRYFADKEGMVIPAEFIKEKRWNEITIIINNKLSPIESAAFYKEIRDNLLVYYNEIFYQNFRRNEIEIKRHSYGSLFYNELEKIVERELDSALFAAELILDFKKEKIILVENSRLGNFYPPLYGVLKEALDIIELNEKDLDKTLNDELLGLDKANVILLKFRTLHPARHEEEVEEKVEEIWNKVFDFAARTNRKIYLFDHSKYITHISKGQDTARQFYEFYILKKKGDVNFKKPDFELINCNRNNRLSNIDNLDILLEENMLPVPDNKGNIRTLHTLFIEMLEERIYEIISKLGYCELQKSTYILDSSL